MGDKIYNFFWWLAGARRDILAKHKNDHNKYFQMGLAVFMTTCMAMVTGTFAIHIGLVGYENAMTADFKPLALILGFFWGMVIMSMDRTIIVTMQKQGNSIKESTPYQKWQNKKQEILPAIPRVLIALLIAKVVLDPFEVIRYSQEISTNIVKDKRDVILKEQQKGQDEINKIIELNKINVQNLEEKKTLINKAIENAKKNLTEYRNPLNKEINDCKKIENSNYQDYLKEMKEVERQRKSGKGPYYHSAVARANEALSKYDKKKHSCNLLEKENEKKQTTLTQKDKIKKRNKEKEIEKYKKELSEIDTQIADSSSTRDSLKKETNLTIAYTTIVRDSKSSYNKALEMKEKLFKDNEQYRHQHWVFMAFIFMIELLPIITKILANRGSYDAEMKNITERESARHDEELEIFQMESKANIQESALKHSSDYKIQELEHKEEISKKKNEPWLRAG